MEGSVSPKAFHGGQKTQSYMVKLDLKFMKNISKVSPEAGEAGNEPIFNMGIWNFKLNLGERILVKTSKQSAPKIEIQ